jgi:hypothetical protein
VHEEAEAVRRRDDRLDGDGALRLVVRGADHVDAARLQLGAQGGQLVVVELVLERVRLQRRLLDDAGLLRLLEEGGQGNFSKIRQFSSTPFEDPGLLRPAARRRSPPRLT